MIDVTLPCRELAHRIRTKTLTSVELFSGHEANISRSNPSLNALRVFDQAGAKARAAKSDSEIKAGTTRGPLHGIFFCAKDSLDVAGMPGSHGSAHGAVACSPHNAVLVQRALDAGAICIGKTNMAEYGKSYYTENPAFGRTNNPFDLSRSPGGSSGGDSAALAAGFASFALAADSGGSVRVPANFCGLFGLYPTRGILTDGLSSSPPHAISALTRCNGILTKHLDDLEILLSALSGFDPTDPYSVPFPPGAIDRRFSRGRFVYFSGMNGAECDPQIKEQLHAVVKQLQSLGYTAEERCPAEFSETFEIFIILAAQASLILEDSLERQAGTPRNAQSEGPIVQSLRTRVATELPPLTVERLLNCWAKVDFLRFRNQALWREFDFVLSPVAATIPPVHGTSTYPVGSQNLASQLVFQFASSVNVLGLPSIAFPTAMSKERLPLGLQIIGPRFSEYALIDTLRKIGCTRSLPVLQSK